MCVPSRALRHRDPRPHCLAQAASLLFFILTPLLSIPPSAAAQNAVASPAATAARNSRASPPTANRLLRGHQLPDGSAAARALLTARSQHLALLAERRVLLKAHPAVQNLAASWQPLGPSAVQSLSFGTISGRITSLATDPGDPSGNTLYVGSAGGGVWKSTNAMAASGSVSFSPLTDTLPAYSANAGSAATTSLSIGALTAEPGGLVLAGTGDPNDSSDSLYGGGLLRSADGGLTWTLISGSRDGVYGNHSFVGLGFAGFAWSSTTPSLIVAAVSQSVEGTLVNAADSAYSVMGLYFSTDAGLTWQMATVKDGSQVIQSPLPFGGNNGGHAATSVVWNPVRQRFFAAVRYHGYYESTDGQTWTRLATQPSATLTAAACPVAFGQPGNSSCPIFRGALAVDPISGDTFALTVDIHNHDTGLFRDMCARNGGSTCQTGEPTFASRITSTPLETADGSGTVAQGDYNLALYAVPASGDTVLFAGTHDLFRCSVASGCVLRNTTNVSNGCNAPAHVGSALHSIAGAAAGSPPGVFFGNDSGLWRSTDLVNQQASVCSDDDAAHFQNLNGGLGSLSSVVSFAQDPAASGVLLAGLGADGTASSSGSGWVQLSAGEGGSVAINPTDPSLWYFTSAAGISINRCSNGAACAPADAAVPPVIGSSAVSDDDARLDAPWLLDPADPSQLLAGTCRVWRGPAADRSLWSTANALSPMLGGPQAAACDVINNPLIRALAVGGAATSGSASPVIYAGFPGALSGGGTIAGHIFANASTGPAAWTDVALSPVTNDQLNQSRFNPGAFDISSIVVDAHDKTGGTVYVTVQGFTNNSVSAPHVYRTVDAGAHWLNLSSNLPNAPANSVLVDPNDANTVYVAMDTGVYVTSAVGACATGNCWTVLGTSLPNAPALQLTAGVQLPTGDGRHGELRVSTAGRGIWQIPLLTALADTVPAISVSTTALAFGSQSVGTLSGSQVVTITNSGVASLTISQIATTGDFQATTSCTGSAIAVGASCVVQVVFLPTATGTRTGLLTIYGNVVGGQATISLSGTATAAAPVVLTPVMLPFPVTSVGASSAAENISISNTGANAATLGTPSLAGDFVLSASTCGLTLAPDTGCTIAITFAPKATGTRTGTVTVVTSNGTLTAGLSGSATAPPTDTLSATALSFSAQAISGASAAQTVILANAGDQPLTLITAAITAGDFAVVNSCGNSLAGHSSCALNVSFVPSQLGAQTGSLVVSDAYRSQSIALSGTGIAPPGVSVSPAHSLTFAATPVGTSAASQAVTLTNNGGLPITISQVVLTGDFALAAGSSCGGSLAAVSSCAVNVVFSPAATGARYGTLTITDSSPSSPHTLALNGSGLDFTVGADGQTSATLSSSGGNAAFPMLVTTNAGVAGSAAVQCTGLPTNSTCVVSPATISLATGGSTLVVATVSTGVGTAAALRLPSATESERTQWLAMLVPVSLLLLGIRRNRARWPALLVLVLAVGGISGCGTSRTIPPSGTGDGAGGGGTGALTPPGTYKIAVTVSSGGLTREVDFTLTVQ